VILPSVTVTDNPQEPSQLLACAVLKTCGVLEACVGRFEDTLCNAFRTRSSEESAPYATRPVTAEAFRKSRRLTTARLESLEIVTNLRTDSSLRKVKIMILTINEDSIILSRGKIVNATVVPHVRKPRAISGFGLLAVNLMNGALTHLLEMPIDICIMEVVGKQFRHYFRV
jgi:hypothetical protein